MNHMPSLYFCHYACFIFARRMLYEPIEKPYLEFAGEIIKNYVEFLGNYLGNHAYDFTVHAHLHPANQVEKHGPLKFNSQFVFEVS